jgi:hypothetical protein
MLKIVFISRTYSVLGYSYVTMSKYNYNFCTSGFLANTMKEKASEVRSLTNIPDVLERRHQTKNFWEEFVDPN